MDNCIYKSEVFCSCYSSKVDQIQDIVTGNPTVIKMVVSFNRGARGQNTLRQLLAPVVKEIMEDKSLIINTSPVDVYKSWVNQLEMQTGEARWVRRLDLLYHTHEESLSSAFLFFLWEIVLVSMHPFSIFLHQRDFGEGCLRNRCFNLFWTTKGSLSLSWPSKVNYLIFISVIDYAMEQLSLFLKFFTNSMLVVFPGFWGAMLGWGCGGACFIFVSSFCN